jgi:hypothetical protein
VEPTRRHTEEPQDRWQWKILAGPIHGAQDPRLGASVRETLPRETKPGGAEQGQREPEERRELPDASPQFQDFLAELRFSEVHNIETDHDRRCSAQPATRRRARDSEVRGDGHVAGALDEISKAVVIALLRARRSRHADDHRPFPHAAQLLEDDTSVRADVTTTRAAKRRMSMGTALLTSRGMSLTLSRRLG